MTDRDPNELPPNAIAVVGMAGRFPGAGSVSEFWRNLRDGVEAIVSLTEDELLAAGVGEKALASNAYIRRAALMDGVEEFDAEFFGFTPYAARMLDPQHRLFLQTAWHALEDAGYVAGLGEKSIGVFGTSSASGYLLHNLMSHLDPNAIIGEGATFEMVNLSLQNDKDHLATRVAHQFNLRGPALSVQTACSSSMVAVHLACQSILNGECEMALAGGSSIRVPHRVGYWHEPGSMVSATGHCRPFDVRADGTIFGSGVGVVVLKALQDALDAGDRIHAVIRGSAVNNDGSTKMNYAAPNAAGQAEAIAEAHAVADVDASTISFVETHGTGTPLGDPIEIEGLRQAFDLAEGTRGGPCVLGSVKSNIGHLEVASGIAGLIKTILCLSHRALPGTLHYTRPNPELRLDTGPFEIRAGYGPWEWDGPLRAGVSSFGVGGTNVHIVLEEAPATAAADAVAAGPQVLLLSARTDEALEQARAALATELADGGEFDMAGVAATLAGRRTERVRLAAAVTDQRHAVEVLRTPEHDNLFVGSAPAVSGNDDRVVFVFPGQGAQHVGMARGLYDREPVFAEHFDQCIALFDRELDIDLRSAIFEGTARGLERTDRAQPALFTVEYALAQLVMSRGVRPSALAGHSIGEYAAATVAGVFDLSTAVTAVSVRAGLMHAAPRGVMVAVAMSADEIAEHLTPDVDLATVNDPGSCVVAGSEDAIAAFQDALAGRGVVARRVRTSHAFHSRLMDPVVGQFSSQLSRLTLSEPRIPLLSNVTGTWMSNSEACDPAMWARQIRATVRFADELGVLLAMPDRVLVEVGPGSTLTASAARHPRWAPDHRAVRLMRHQTQNRGDHETYLVGLGQLWAGGVDVDWTGDAPSTRVSLPGYPFVRQRHWVDYNPASRWRDGDGAAAAVSAPAAQAAQPAARGASPMEATLQRIWSQCLGVASVDRNADFFDVGGDSLIAISVAMTASREGLDLTPQDLYDNPTVAALATALVARYADGGLARDTLDPAVPTPVPPNVAHFLDNGLRDAGRWRTPLLLRLRGDVTLDDVSSVLVAVTNHHDALRVRLVQQAGDWEQHTADAVDSVAVATATLPDGDGERDAVLALLDRQIAAAELSGPPLAATFVETAHDGPNYLALSLHGLAGDPTSRDILLMDLFTAFGQRLCGQPVVLQHVPTTWREWSRRSVGLVAHPAVLGSRQYWLDAQASATLRLADRDAPEPPSTDDLMRLSVDLTAAESAEVDDARRRLRLPVDDFLLAALGSAVAASVGEGVLTVDLAGQGRSVLKPDVDLGRTVGWFTTVYPVALRCSSQQYAAAADELGSVRDTVKAVPHYGIGYGLLRYLHAPTARALAASPNADVAFTYAGVVPELPDALTGNAPVQFDPDTSMAVRDTVPGLGHPVALRIYRAGAVFHIDWWYDSRRTSPDRVQTLAREYSAALLALARDAIADDDLDAEDEELALVDLSSSDLSTDIGVGEAHARQ